MSRVRMRTFCPICGASGRRLRLSFMCELVCSACARWSAKIARRYYRLGP